MSFSPFPFHYIRRLLFNSLAVGVDGLLRLRAVEVGRCDVTIWRLGFSDAAGCFVILLQPGVATCGTLGAEI